MSFLFIQTVAGTTCRGIIAPRVKSTVESSTCRFFPLGIGGQSVWLARGTSEPACIRVRVIPAQAHSRLVRCFESLLLQLRRSGVARGGDKFGKFPHRHSVARD